MFIMSLRIERVVPTVNVGSENSRKRMKAWLDKWYSDRGKGGTVKPRLRNDGTGEQAIQQWDGKGKNREAWW
jgi:DNA cross-link repair 1A protein